MIRFPSLRSLALLAMFALAGAGFAQEGGPAPSTSVSKPQHEVARKDARFAKVSANEAATLGAIAASDMATLRSKVEKEATVAGKVVAVFRPGSNSIVLLNFARNYRDALTVGVKSAHFAAFPDLRTLEGKQVIVVGKVALYRDRPQILIEKPSQLRIVETP